MTYNAGTATDHLDMLDQLIEVVTSRHLDTLAVNAGGTGHAIGDIIDITATGSTSTHLCKIEVVTLSGSAIATARIQRGGAYTVDPTTITANAQSATTGSGTGATFDLTFAATGWSLIQRNERAVTSAPTITAAGTGYSVSDVLTLVGGVLVTGGAAATFTVSTVGGSGEVTALTNTTQGDYEILPSNPAQVTVAPSGGTGCTLTVTAEDTPGEINVTLQGDAGANTDPLVGIKTYSHVQDESATNTVYNWAMFGMTAWSDTAGMHAQSNVSPGFNTSSNDGALTANVNGEGAFVPLKDSTATDIEWEIRATGRSVTVAFRTETVGAEIAYPACSFGLLNQFGITTEIPFPAYVAGTSDRLEVWYGDGALSSIFGSIVSVIQRARGPLFVWTPEGTWLEAKNALITSNVDTSPSYATSNDAPRIQVWPLGTLATHQEQDDRIWGLAPSTGFDNQDITDALATQIYRTPDTGGNLFPLYPVTIVQADSATDFYRVFGEIDGVWWLSGNDAAVVSKDRFTQGALAYTIFQSGTQTQPYNFWALEEN